MKILIHGRFFPSVGGIETVVNLLAREWAKAGDEVIIVSNLSGTINRLSGLPFRVVYQPSPFEWFQLVKWSEVILQMNLSLKAVWPHLALRRPLVISHQSFYRSCRSYSSYSDCLKLGAMPWAAANVAASAAIADSLTVPCRVIPNPYDSTLFNRVESAARQNDLIFVGRLVAEKGAGMLLRALEVLKCARARIRLTIVGEGPEREALERQALKLNLSNCVRFAGRLDQKGVANELQRHKILVVPSYGEPFGVVALEGAACGCFVLGSDDGGLPETIGPAGTTFRSGDLADLCSKIASLIQCTPEGDLSAIAVHLERHQPRQISSEYRAVFEELLRQQPLARQSPSSTR